MFLSSHCFSRTVLNSENGLKPFLSHCDNPKFTPFDYSTARVYVNRKTRIKRAKKSHAIAKNKNRARQKIARARTTLRHQPH